MPPLIRKLVDCSSITLWVSITVGKPILPCSSLPPMNQPVCLPRSRRFGIERYSMVAPVQLFLLETSLLVGCICCTVSCQKEGSCSQSSRDRIPEHFKAVQYLLCSHYSAVVEGLALRKFGVTRHSEKFQSSGYVAKVSRRCVRLSNHTFSSHRGPCANRSRSV